MANAYSMFKWFPFLREREGKKEVNQITEIAESEQQKQKINFNPTSINL